MLIPIALPEVQLDPITVLAGDIGGTKTNLALFRMNRDGFKSIHETKFASKDFDSFNSIVQQFLNGQQSPERISIGVAGPVQNGKVKLTNLKWELDQVELQKQTGVKSVRLINDLEASAYGLAILTPNEIATVHHGDKNSTGNMAIIAPGTGLGEAGLYWDGQNYHPFATEGGHGDFAPRTELDVELLQYLQKKFGHVSWERLVSGPGIHHIYQFLREEKHLEQPPWLAKKIDQEDPGKVISQNALAGDTQICTETMQLFIHFLAEEAANLVLKLKATGGVFIGGGIAPKIRTLLTEDAFLSSFCYSGTMTTLLEKVPVKIILNEKTALLGAAYYGAHKE